MLGVLVVSAAPARPLAAQVGGVDRLALRFAGMTAVTGLEQAMTDSLIALLPGSVHDRALALRHLDRAALTHQVIFIWSVREEIGLEGAAVAARALGTTPRRVHAIDTFVSADSPLELPNFAVAPLGQGAVGRALDNSSVTPPAYVDSLIAVARARNVRLQVGTTNGGNDGSVFTPFGVVDVAIGWPLRYSHSPVEVVDLRDVASLADLIQSVAETW